MNVEVSVRMCAVLFEDLPIKIHAQAGALVENQPASLDPFFGNHQPMTPRDFTPGRLEDRKVWTDRHDLGRCHKGHGAAGTVGRDRHTG